MPNKSTFLVNATNLSITRNPTGSNVADIIPKGIVTHVSGVYNKKPRTGTIRTGVITGNYTVGETITGGTSGATGIFVGYEGVASAPKLKLRDIIGNFVSAETLTGGTSGATSTSASTVTFTNYEGEWIYPYNTMTMLQIERNDGSKLEIELQDVSNQGTWNTGTLGALQTAVAAIQAWL